MTLGKFKEITKNLPDNTVILISISDHGYRDVMVYKAPAILDASNYYWSENWEDPEVTPHGEKGPTRHNVLIME